MMTSEFAASPRRDLRLLLIASVLAAAVVIAVFTVGIDRPPELPLLRDEQTVAPAVPIAWTSWTPEAMCLYIGETDGTVRTVTCEIDGELVGFDTDGPLHLLRYGGGGFSPAMTLVAIDRNTGEVIETRRTDDTLDYSGLREPTSVRDGNELVVRWDGRDVWRVRARRSYTVFSGRASPDGQHLVLTDSAQRLVLITVDENVPVRVWVDAQAGRDRFSPNMVLWEGESVVGGA